MPWRKILIWIFEIAFFLISLVFVPYKTSAADSFVKYPQNPLFSRLSNNWDSVHVANPSILKINGEYKMWYSGNNGAGWRIGYASSPNGIDNWTRGNLPVIDLGSADGWERHTESPFVLYNSALGKYQMWYSSTKSIWT